MRFNDKMKSLLPAGLYIDESRETNTLRVITFKWIPAHECYTECRWLGIDPVKAVAVELTVDNSLMIPNYEAVIIDVPVKADGDYLKLGLVAAWRSQFWVYHAIPKHYCVDNQTVLRLLGNPLRIE